MLKIKDISIVTVALFCMSVSGAALAKDSSEQAQSWLQRMVVDSEK